MGRILHGISGLLSHLVRSKKEVNETDDEEIENIIKEVALQREKITPTRDQIGLFGRTTRDDNPIHFFPEAARAHPKLGLTDTPVMGAHMAAYAEQFIQDILKRLQVRWPENGGELQLLTQWTKFKDPTYPENRILWEITKYKPIKEKDYLSGIELSIMGRVGEKIVLEAVSTIGNTRPVRQPTLRSIFDGRYLIEPANIWAFNECVGNSNREEAPYNMAVAYVPATLLTLLEKKTKSREGINAFMDFEFFNRVKPGHLYIDLMKEDEPRPVGKDYRYKFLTCCRQDDQVCALGTITCYKGQYVKLRNSKNTWDPEEPEETQEIAQNLEVIKTNP